MTKSAKERMREYRQRLREEKKKQVLVTLEPDAHHMVEEKRKREGLTYSEAVNALVKIDPQEEAKRKEYAKKAENMTVENMRRNMQKMKHEIAMKYARMAIAQLECIQDIDPDRDEAFAFVQNWLNENKRKESSNEDWIEPSDDFLEFLGRKRDEMAMKYARLATYQLERIDPTHHDKYEALDFMIDWIEDFRKQVKGDKK